ncbi:MULTISPECIES: hypothetical protein [Pseudanabaena]|uniref:Uncharacterized protein n=2 Tax=Pseudanabaena TaxID=1152 RepID=L8MXC7_9CYAN|nr:MULTISPECIES: hypothetical protein [Pseudanabaena]ELS30648.1 hypothetical protein Pse7429DRAFT_4221 [Pseudanabaena biceps PCC 7429]MDG3497084.1 hypothetical protein [Pseudanabaena catenata USMAC16]
MSQFKLFNNLFNNEEREDFFFPLWTWMLLASLGLHLTLLLLPNMLKQKTDETHVIDRSESQKIRVIELPSTPVNSLKSSPYINSQSLSLIDKTSASNPQPVSQNYLHISRNNFLNASLPKQELPQEQPISKAITKEHLVTQVGSENQSSETKASSQDVLKDPFVDFPQYPNAETGSFGLLQGQEDLASQQTSDRQDVVALYFEKELPARDYEIKTLSSDSTRKVYQIFKGGLSKFLNLIVREGKGTAIVLASKPLDLENLQSLVVASKAETDFDIVLKHLSELGAQRIAIPEFYFAQPEKFYAKSVKDRNSYDIEKPQFGFDGNFVVILDKNPEQLFSNFFASQLQNHKFEISQMSDYGGGLIYKVKQGSFVRYLNLLPTQSGVGTIVVIWKILPKYSK